MEEKRNIKLYLIIGILILIVIITTLLLIFQNINKQPIKEASGMIEEVSVETDDEAEIIEVIKKNVVKIENKLENISIIGTGFFHKTGYLITNSHIVDIEGEITIEYYDGQKEKATLVSNDISSDVAVLVVEEPKALAMKFANTLELKVTNEVWAVGYPYGFNGEASVSKGILSARRSAGGIEFLQTDMSLNTGFSGGPLVDKNGMLLGINSFATENSTIGMSISAENLETIIEKLIENKKDNYLEGERPENVLGVVLTEIGHKTEDLYNEKHITNPKEEKHEENKPEKEENVDNSKNNNNNNTNKKEEPFVDLPTYKVLSSDASLKSLQVENYELEKGLPKYSNTIILKNNEKSLNIIVETNHPGATYTITGNEDFKKGENVITIKVISEDQKSSHEYWIKAIHPFKKLDRVTEVELAATKRYNSNIGANSIVLYLNYKDRDGVYIYPEIGIEDILTKIKVDVYKGWSPEDSNTDIEGKPMRFLKSYEFNKFALSQREVEFPLSDIKSLLNDEDYNESGIADITIKAQIFTREQGTFYSRAYDSINK